MLQEKTMTEKSDGKLKEGFYWCLSFYRNILLVYYSSHIDPDDENTIFVKLFDERGKYGTLVTEPNRLTPFSLENDIGRLNPEVAEKVRETLEELAQRTG